MANHKSAMKKYRRDEKLRLINKANRSKMRNQIKSLRKLVESGEMEDAKTLLPKVISVIDRTVSKGTIHRQAGARYKSRLSKLVQN